jgi:hypothetical protein
LPIKDFQISSTHATGASAIFSQVEVFERIGINGDSDTITRELVIGGMKRINFAKHDTGSCGGDPFRCANPVKQAVALRR